MNQFSILLEGKLSYLKSYNGYNLVVNLTKLRRILLYFKEYPLKTKKSIDCPSRLGVYELVINKEHLNLQGLEKINKLKNQINKNLDKEIEDCFESSCESSIRSPQESMCVK